ncbi:hypothetical protein NMY22_g11076 [Coprinellus aureogranulatus]|nr:hypothetical protein NMY22_g11076 [Coprinellus aureogranulatus]
MDCIPSKTRDTKTEIKSVCLVGGFSTNTWLHERVRNELEPFGILAFRPDTYGNGAVASGAVLFYLDNLVASRLARATYGTTVCTVFDIDVLTTCSDGPASFFAQLQVNGFSQTCLRPSLQSACLTAGVVETFSKDIDPTVPFENVVNVPVLAYPGLPTEPLWVNENSDSISVLCTIEADISRVQPVWRRSSIGTWYQVVRYDVVLLLGLTELKAQIAYFENGVEKRTSYRKARCESQLAGQSPERPSASAARSDVLRNKGPDSFSSSPAPSSSRKRQSENNENQPPAETPSTKRRKKGNAGPLTEASPFNGYAMPSFDAFTTPQQPSKQNEPLLDDEKFDRLCDAIDDLNWSFAGMLGFAFLHPGTITRSHRHAGIISRFLRGESLVTPGEILRLWDNHPDGRIEREEQMFSTEVHYAEIKPVRPSLTHILRCSEVYYKSPPRSFSGCQARSRSPCIRSEEIKGDESVRVAAHRAFNRDGPAVPKPPPPPRWMPVDPEKAVEVPTSAPGATQVQSTQNGGTNESGAQGTVGEGSVVAVRVQTSQVAKADGNINARRPANLVVTHALSSLLYKRNSEARILPLSLGLLAFSYSTPVDFMAYCSRIAIMPAYTTISGSLKHFAADQAAHIRAHGSGATTAGFIQTDNVQNYLRVRDYRIGSVNKMNIGLAATYCELPDIDISSLDLEDRKKRIAENKRASLTFDMLFSYLNMEHLNTIISLHKSFEFSELNSRTFERRFGIPFAIPFLQR